jgi:hypothetical protein
MKCRGVPHSGTNAATSWRNAEYDDEHEDEIDAQLKRLFTVLSVCVPLKGYFETFRLPAQLTPP